MVYDDLSKNAVLKYKREKQHPINISYKKEEYENVIRPAIKKSGLPTATFIKEAIYEKIERDHLL